MMLQTMICFLTHEFHFLDIISVLLEYRLHACPISRKVVLSLFQAFSPASTPFVVTVHVLGISSSYF